MKIKSIVLCLVLILIANCTEVLADSVFENVKIEYSRETGIVNIEGMLTSDSGESVARLMVLKPNTDEEKLIDGTLSFKECGVHASETVVSEKFFEFAPFKISDVYEAGDYIIRIAYANEIYTEKLSVASVNQTMDFVNNVSDAESLKDFIEKYNDVYQLDMGEGSLYDGFEEDGKTYVLSQLCNKDYDNVKAFQDEFKVQSVLYKVYTGPWGTLEDVILSNSDILMIDMTEFNSLSATKQDEVCKTLCGNSYYNTDSLKKAFNAEVEKAQKEQSSDKKDSTSSRPSGGSGSSGDGGKTYYSEMEKPTASPEPTIKPTEEIKEETFSDLHNHEWAKSSIEFLKKKGVVDGRGDGTFEPDAYITRSEAMKIVILALDKVNDSANCNFDDVPINSWAYPYVATATEQGIIYGYDDGSFGADDNITREDLAVIVMRAVLYYGIDIGEMNDEVEFADNEEISTYAKEAVKHLHNANIINGMDGYFQPKGFATRAQMAKIIASVIS